MLTFLATALAAPCTPSIANTCWEGVWTKDAHLSVSIQDNAGVLTAKLLLDGDMVSMGELNGTGPKRQAPLEGCGGDFALVDGMMKLQLDGPECPIDFVGTYRAASTTVGPKEVPTLCGALPTVFSCTTTKKKIVSVCGGDALAYRFGSATSTELSLSKGAPGERSLASGTEKTWTFTNDGYGYQVFEVTSRPEDTGAGVLISKDGKDVATVRCSSTWYTAE